MTNTKSSISLLNNENTMKSTTAKEEVKNTSTNTNDANKKQDDKTSTNKQSTEVRNKIIIPSMTLRDVLNVAVDETHTLQDVIKTFPEKMQPKLIRTLDMKLPRFSGKAEQINWFMNKCVVLTDFMKIWSEKDSGYYYRFQFVYYDKIAQKHPILVTTQNGSREIKAAADLWEKERNEKGGSNNAIKKSVIGQKLHIRRVINKGMDGSDRPTNSYYFEEYHWDDVELADVMCHSYGIDTTGLGDEDFDKFIGSTKKSSSNS